MSGVNDGTLREIESRVGDRPVVTMARIAEALECRVHDLLREMVA